jgi:peptidoglycan/LPS O-acetylase OafA/YrhL
MAMDLNPDRNDTSTTLDLLRALAAFAVLIGHSISFFQVAPALQPPNLPYMQNMAVIGFFVLSGFLIAFVLDRSREQTVWTFIIDRFARIFSSFLPAMILISILAWGLYAVGMLETKPSIAGWFENLLMLNAYGNSICKIVCVSNYYTAGHLWSLAVEWHIYLFAGFSFFAIKQRSIPLMIAALISSWVPYIYLGTTAALSPGNQIFYMWILGFAAYYLTSRVTIPLIGALALGITSIILLRNTIRPAYEYDLQNYVWIAAAFVAIIAVSQSTSFLTKSPKLRASIKYVADFSFSLYLVHHPLQFALQKFWPDSGWLGASVGILAPIPVAMLVAHFGERRHKRLASLLKSRLIKDNKATNDGHVRTRVRA